jgi:hypothetical protein
MLTCCLSVCAIGMQVGSLALAPCQNVDLTCILVVCKCKHRGRSDTAIVEHVSIHAVCLQLARLLKEERCRSDALWACTYSHTSPVHSGLCHFHSSQQQGNNTSHHASQAETGGSPDTPGPRADSTWQHQQGVMPENPPGVAAAGASFAASVQRLAAKPCVRCSSARSSPRM